MFDDMNAGFYRLPTLNFRNTIDRSVTGFLANFDAIFTLNQDLLLEHHYLTNDPSLQSQGKWSGATMPGVKPTTPFGNGGDLSWANRSFVPLPEDQFCVQDRMQPLYKLHGSSNWHTDDGHSMPVITAIIGSRQPVQLTNRFLQNLDGLPLNWADQDQLLLG